MNQLWIYTPHITNRHRYIAHILQNHWGVQINFTHDEIFFKELNFPKINYSTKTNLADINITPQGLLENQTIKKFDFTTLECDAFAMIFFLLTRYEEYLIKERDKHQRFSAKSSYLCQTNRLQIPWVDQLLNDLSRQIQFTYPDEIKFKNHSFKTEFTIDVDQVFCYRGKSITRFVGANIRDFFGLNFKKITDRKLCYLHLKKDPWNVFDEIQQISKLKKNMALIFYLVGDYGKFNKNLDWKNQFFQRIIKKTDSWAKIGLHPSYNSYLNTTKIQQEKIRLESILDKEIIKSRQHYLQFQIPKTYQNLLQAGIKEDYTMGYADDIGFRAGTSFPFTWYDLNQEKITALKIHPFCAMDVTLKKYLNLNQEQAQIQLETLYEEVKKVNGVFSIITHNESLSGYQKWKGWKPILIKYWE